MAIAEFTEVGRDTFNTEERRKIEQFAEKMFKQDMIRAYVPLGKKEVCMERESLKERTIQVFLMNGTLEMNNELVTRFNKRKKAGRSRPGAEAHELSEWHKVNTQCDMPRTN